MKKKLQKLSLLLVNMFLFSTISWGQTLISETLTTGTIPAGWNESDVGFVTAAGGYARFDETTSVLTTPTFNASANASIDIEFDVAKFGSGGDGPLTVEYSLDGGANWTIEGNSTTPTSATYLNNTISVNATSANMQVRFTRASSPSQKRLRNVVIEGIGVGTSPNIGANPNTLTGFTQFLGSPSAEQDFEVTGVNLTDDVELTVTTGDFFISETSGGLFTNSITLTQASGSVGPTTIYVVLNGAATANPSNGEITITSSGASNATVTLEGQILDPDPTVFVSTNSLTGFSHFVGTPSAEETFDVSGDFLTDDLEVTAPANYEVSLTSGSGFGPSVSITNSGTVAATPIYVRLNGPAANYTQNGDITVTSSGANTENVALEGETLDYTLYPIASVTTNNTDGVADSLDVYVELRGIVHCIDFDGDDGYSFTIIDGPGDGINVFNFNDVNGYVVTEGDSIGVKGYIDQFNGLTQIFVEEINVFNQGNATVTPLVVTALDESTESQLITLEGLTLVDGETNWPNNGNINVTNGTDIFTVRIVSASPLSGELTPVGPFDITGLGGQFDNSLPYDEGYQLYPCDVTELCNLDISTSVNDLTISAVQSGVDYQWVDCNDDFSPIAGATSQTFEATDNGSYAVVLTDGACSDTSDCVEITTVGISVNALTTQINAFPNPVSNQLNIVAGQEKIIMVEVYTTSGKIIFNETFDASNVAINTNQWDNGVYFVKATTLNGTVTLKVVK
jgi:hypothetical protein